MTVTSKVVQAARQNNLTMYPVRRFSDARKDGTVRVKIALQENWDWKSDPTAPRGARNVHRPLRDDIRQQANATIETLRADPNFVRAHIQNNSEVNGGTYNFPFWSLVVSMKK